MAIVTGNSAVVTVTSLPEGGDKEFHSRLMRHRLAVSLVDSMITREIISPAEAAIIYTILAEKHGLSSGSIFL